MRSLSADVLVCGGGFAGVAAALSAARAGRRVCLLEQRTYPGAEITATLRPWLAPSQYVVLRDLFALPADFAVPVGDEYAIVPDRLKTALEDLLLAAGVTLLYAVWPVAVQSGAFVGVEAFGKAGRLRLEAAALVDATEQAQLARLVCPAAPLPTQAGARLWRTLELTGVQWDQVGVIPSGRVHSGYAGAELGHVLVEHAIDWVPGGSPGWQNAAELAARRISADLSRQLRQHHPAFAEARLAASSHELLVPPLWRVGPDPRGQVFVPAPVADRDPAALAQAGLEAGARAAAAPPATGPALAEVRLPVVTRAVDVLVIGGGSSGAAAAIGAARRSAATLIADMNPAFGGTGTLGGVDSYWFGRRGGFNQEVSRWVTEQQEQAAGPGPGGAKWNTEAKMLAWQAGARAAGVEPRFCTVLAEVRTDGAGRVTGARLAAPDCLVEVTAGVTIDATGDGDAAVAAGARAVYGSDRESATMWYSLAPYSRPGVSRNNFTSMVDVGDPFDYTRAILSARRRLPGHDHGPYVAPRESRHVLGQVRLTLTDILTMRHWPDVINLHISNHDIKGQNCSDWLRMGLIPPNLEVEIPYGALVPQGVDGLLVTGKAISATHDALPPLRMQADLENLGYITGIAAGLCARQGITPRHLDIPAFQTLLVQEGLLPPAVLERGAEPPPAAAAVSQRAGGDRPLPLAEAIAQLDDSDRLFQYGEMPMDAVRRAPIPMVQVCTAPPGEAIPLLRAALAEPGHKGRLHLARALAWHGDHSATPVLLQAIAAQLNGDELPPRTAHISYTQASPDHGAMPELAYLLHTLAMARDEAAIPVLQRVGGRLNPTPERLRDQMSGLFHYVDSLCDIAERLGHPDCVPALRLLQGCPLFRDQVSTAAVLTDFFAERQAYLEIVIARALARCGDKAGAATLVRYLRDVRRPLVTHAYRELTAISGRRLPPEPDAWQDWLSQVDKLAPCPWTGGHEAENQ